MGRPEIRHAVARGLDSLGVPGLLRSLRSGLRVVLYHHVAELCDFTRHLGCVTPPSVFERHVDWLAKHYELVSIGEVGSGKPLPKRALLITFDDAYGSVKSVAGSILKDRGLPSVLFLATDPVFHSCIVLDNLLSFAFSRYPDKFREIVGLADPNPVARLLLQDIPSGTVSERAALRLRVSELCGAEAWNEACDNGLYLTRTDVEELPSLGMAVSRHTRSHVSLRMLDDPRDEVETDWSSLGLPASARAFSFPFGSFRDAPPKRIARMLELGFGPLFLVEGCSNPRPSQVYFRTSPVSCAVSELAADLECFSRLRRLKKRDRINRITEFL